MNAHSDITRLDNAIEKFDNLFGHVEWVSQIGGARQGGDCKAFPGWGYSWKESRWLAEFNVELDIYQHESEILEGGEE